MNKEVATQAVPRTDVPRPLSFEEQEFGTTGTSHLLDPQHAAQVGIDLVVADAKHELLPALNVKLHSDLTLVQVY
jgi:hypothetical protein